MAEIGIILSIASLIKLSTKVLIDCAEYIDKVKNAPADIDKIINEVSGLEFILKRLSTLASSTSDDDARLIALKEMLILPSGLFQACNEALSDIAKTLEKITASNVLRRRLLWPFEGGKLEELLKGLKRHKSTLRSALSADTAEMQIATDDTVNRIGSQLEVLKADEERKQIVEWLKGADPSMNHNSAIKKHEPGTGDWLLNSKEFKEWLDGDMGILWLYGIPGAGKTILSSRVVEHVKKQKQREGELRAKIAYYYFDFNDQAKQTAHGCIQSLVKQLFAQSVTTPDELRSSYNENRHGTPSLDQLIGFLIMMLGDGMQNFIVIDALDECKEEERQLEREAFFQCLQEIKSSLKSGYNLFIASRPEPDIKRELTELSTAELSMEKGLVDEDIRSHLQARLPKIVKFKRWPEAVKKEIETTLVTQANGMFRWAECQLDALKLCAKPANALKQLHNLPKTLEDTYARIIQRVPVENVREMKSILMLLAFSARPMTIQEVAEATAVDLESQKFSVDERFGDPYDILELCSSLVSLSEVGSDTGLRKEMQFRQLDKDLKIVAFAHFSVKDYIVSDMFYISFPKTFHIAESLCRSYLTEMCLIYLLDFNGGERTLDIDHKEYPFLAYAALHWTTHLTLIPKNARAKVMELLIRLFDPDHMGSLMNYLNLYNPVSSFNIQEYQRSSTRTVNFGTQYRNKRDFQSPLYYACYYGIGLIVDALLGENGAYSHSSEELGCALEAAASNGHDEIIQRLLKEGADVNAIYCPQYFRPIQAAASSGYPSTITLLLSAGADISPQSYGGEWGTALHVAANQGNPACTQILVDAGHELDYVQPGGYHRGTALAIAASKENDALVACLIKNGANPRTFSSWHNSPLNLASEYCSVDSVRLILDAGANVHGGGGKTPLHEAAVRGDLKIMKLLLDHGADINAPGGTYGTPLKGAIQSRDFAAFKFMLDHGADINFRGSKTKYPVDQAIFGGNLEAADKLLEMGAEFSDEALAQALDWHTKEYLVEELLKRGADPNAAHERYGNLLQLAIEKRCKEETIRTLLAAGADVNLVEGEHGTALQAAVVGDHREEIVRLLLEYGAELNTQPCGADGNPLQAAIIYTLEPITNLLLDKGADVNAEGGRYGTIIQAAARTGNEDLVRRILARGVDVDKVGGEYGTALRAAIAMDHEPVVKLLLDAGADPNVKIEASHSTKASRISIDTFTSAVEVVIHICNTSMFRILKDHGMELSSDVLEMAFVQAVTTPGTDNKLKMIDFLISEGADIKKYGGMALFFACGWNSVLEVVQKLISLGSPLNFSMTGTIGSALMHAITESRKEVIQALLDAGADINLAAGESGTALITAIDKGNNEMAMKLLDRGADPNIKAGKWGTALATAAKRGEDEIFHELLRRGADINITYGYFGTALQSAITSDYYDLAYELLNRGANPAAPGLYASPLICASGYGKSGQVELIKHLISLGVDLEVFDGIRPEDSDNLGNRAQYSALQIAAMAGNEATTKLLLDSGANINAVGGTYGTALIVAINEKNDSIIRLLLDRGADINIQGGRYGTALQAAASGGIVWLVELLLEKGADVNIESGEYGTALQAACSTSKSKVVEELLSRGSEIHTNCGQHGNPLQAAVCSGNLEHIKTLIGHGADVNHPGGQYGFALQAAACSHNCDPGDLNIMKYLIDMGARINAVGGEYGTALQAAAYHHMPYVELLLKNGADPKIEGGIYGSAIGAAKEKGFNRVVKLLALHMDAKL